MYTCNGMRHSKSLVGAKLAHKSLFIPWELLATLVRVLKASVHFDGTVIRLLQYHLNKFTICLFFPIINRDKTDLIQFANLFTAYRFIFHKMQRKFVYLHVYLIYLN